MSTPSRTPVLVTGATGTIGGELVRLLAAGGHPVRAMVRRPDQAERFRADGVDTVLADLDDRVSLARAMAGVEQLFLLTAPTPQQWQHERAALDTAAAAGVRRIVRVSAGDSNISTDVPWARTHARADTHLAGLDVSWTVLRPTAFLQNLAGSAPAIRRGVLPQTTGSGAESWIDARDIAAVAARVLTTDGHDRATYFLTGPQALTGRDVAAALGRALGRRVRYVQLPSRLFAALLRIAGGVDRFTARGLRTQFAGVVRPGHDIDTTQEVERLTGRPARSIDEYLSDHLDTFR